MKKIISPSTINRRLIETGQEIKEFIKNKNQNLDNEKQEHFYADGTKSHNIVKKTNIKMISK